MKTSEYIYGNINNGSNTITYHNKEPVYITTNYTIKEYGKYYINNSIPINITIDPLVKSFSIYNVSNTYNSITINFPTGETFKTRSETFIIDTQGFSGEFVKLNSDWTCNPVYNNHFSNITNNNSITKILELPNEIKEISTNFDIVKNGEYFITNQAPITVNLKKGINKVILQDGTSKASEHLITVACLPSQTIEGVSEPFIINIDKFRGMFTLIDNNWNVVVTGYDLN